MPRSRHDREILRLAVPALGALAAEPLYLLVDTAIVGHLGTRELAAFALAATVLGPAVSLCIFLTYGTTARVARLHGGGRDAEASAVAPQALWLALLVGGAVALAIAALAAPLVALLGGEGATADAAARYLRIAALGVPCALLALAGQGWLRGVGDLRSPLVVIAVSQAVNAALTAWFVLGLDLGLDGSAAATVVAQLGMGAAFAWLLVRRGTWAGPRWAGMRPLASMGALLLVRTAALLACFVLAGAVLARVGEPSLAAHQVGFGLFTFLALVLDAIAIAGQVLIGRALGAGDRDGAREAAVRMLGWSSLAGVVVGGALLAGRDVIPEAFTDDPAVLGRADAMWPLFCLLWPVAGVVFALDGVLIGAGDARFLAGAMVLAAAVYVPLVLPAGGIAGVWLALLVLMGVRLVTLGARFARGRWLLA